MLDLRRITREFLIGERVSPDWKAYIQSIEEALSNIRIGSQRDSRRVSMARESLQEIKRYLRRMEERVNTLEEELRVLEEQSTKGK